MALKTLMMGIPSTGPWPHDVLIKFCQSGGIPIMTFARLNIFEPLPPLHCLLQGDS